jgi:lipopolysaccharide transport system ATP-binding protein
LAKAYTIRHNVTDHITLAEVALDRLQHPFRRARREKFWALQDVSFDLSAGEVLGLIGRNGAGKSTLLKVLARITDPTRGEIHLWGRVGSLLEVGTGFHPELTGRENVYLNGAILGMHRKEIATKFDAIVDFAGVDKFLDTPVKRYSSGMFVRLAFAVAAHLDSEILLLDEVLAVGDGDFQAKCLDKVNDLTRSGRAIILVSHNMATMREFASSAILLERGRLVTWGPTDMVIETYLEAGGGIVEEVDVSTAPRYDAAFGGRARITKVRLNHAQGTVAADADLLYTVTVRATDDLGPTRVSQTIFTAEGRAVGYSTSAPSIYFKQGCDTQFDVVLSNPRLAPGHYYLAISVGFGDNSTAIDDLDVVMDSVHFEVAPPISYNGRLVTWHRGWGPIRMQAPDVERVDTNVSS